VIDHPETENDADQREGISAGRRRFKHLGQAACLVSQKILSLSWLHNCGSAGAALHELADLLDGLAGLG
jgi:hypothetical protein